MKQERPMPVLEDRQKLILYSVVQEYILTAQPVGSNTIVKKYSFAASPATVRHELSRLSDLGFLQQPHTSAGRVPTDLGYRYYVDSLMRARKLSAKEERAVLRFYSTLSGEMEELMRATSETLSRMTNCISVVFAPRLARSVVKHVDLVALTSHTLLLVVITDTGRVAKSVLEPCPRITAGQLTRVEANLNAGLIGLDATAIAAFRDKMAGRGAAQGSDGELESMLLDRVLELMAEDENDRAILGGASDILRYPEFSDMRKVEMLLRTLEQGYVLLNLLGEALESSKVVVRIGSENSALSIEGCSLVAGSYGLPGQTLGTVGILGPTRMDYGRAISAVECIARNLSDVLRSIHG